MLILLIRDIRIVAVRFRVFKLVKKSLLLEGWPLKGKMFK